MGYLIQSLCAIINVLVFIEILYMSKLEKETALLLEELNNRAASVEDFYQLAIKGDLNIDNQDVQNIYNALRDLERAIFDAKAKL